MHGSNESRRWFFLGLSLVGVLLVTACVPAAPPSSTPETRSSASAAPTRPARAVLGIWADTDSLQPKLMDRFRDYQYNYSLLINSPLAVRNERGIPEPRLALDIPTQERGTWIVNPDGTMQTTWTIRPNAVWHDGVPVTSQDFALAWAVYMDPEVVVSLRDPERQMDRIEPIDTKSFVVHWKQPYPWADRLGPMQLEPLPEHIVGPLYRGGDKDTFNNASFWTSTAYIGTGPYRLVDWVKGSQLRFQAFGQYYLGAPRLDEVVVRVISDPNAVVGHVLGGEVDVTLSTTISQQTAQTLRERWAVTGEGKFFGFVRSLGIIRIQHHPERVGQPALADVRVRRALVHAIDRAAVVETVLGGGAVADSLLAPDHPLYQRGAPAMPTYPFDLTRARSLLEQAGWSMRGTALTNATGERFKLDISVNDRSDQVAEMVVYADYLTRLGMDVGQNVVSEVQSRDPATHSGFPGLNPAGLPLELPQDFRRYLSDECPTAAKRYTGGNYGCWNNAEYDRLSQIAMTSLVEAERAEATIGAARIWSEDLPSIPVDYSLNHIAVRNGLRGPGTRLGSVADTWNIHQWEWEQGAGPS